MTASAVSYKGYLGLLRDHAEVERCTYLFTEVRP